MLVATSVAAPAAQSLMFRDDGSYRFYYETGKEGGSHTRTEVRGPDGVVIGKFSFEDPDGELREVNYRADETGFVAKGDVGVKGAPKGQFPVPEEEQPAQESPSATTLNDQPAEPSSPQETVEENSQPQATDEGVFDEEEDKDDMQDLALEETSANDPPEAFPPGFFLEKFQGLRRLPEPTNEGEPATTEAATEAEKAEPEIAEEEVKEEQVETTEASEAEAEPVPDEVPVLSFAPVKPFPIAAVEADPAPGISHISHHEWASAMFHQPVYVFAYHQPDSYGYHYYF